MSWFVVSEDTTRSSRREVEREDSKPLLPALKPYQWAAVAVGGLVLIIGLLVLGDYGVYAGKIHRGVQVFSYDVGGLTADQATDLLATELAAAENHEILITSGEHEWSLQGSQVGLAFDTVEMTERAYAHGRTGNLLDQIFDRVALYFRDVTVPLVASFGDEMTITVVSQIEEAVTVDPVDSSVILSEESTFVVTEGENGLMVEVDQLLQELPDAIVAGEPSIEVRVSTVPMGVSLAEAQAAADRAELLANQSITVTYEGNSWDFGAKDLRKLFSFARSDEVSEPTAAATIPPGDGTVLVPVLSQKQVASVVIGATGTVVGTAPVDAAFKTSAGKVTIIPSKTGVGADPAVLARDIMAALQTEGGAGPVEIVTTKVEPEITTEVARGMGIEERISTFTTSFAAGNAPRVANIQLLSKSLDGTLVGPGETFSFNGTIGERTAEKGYQEAGAIVNGKLVNQAGGGICQVSTTLFNTVLLSGLPVDQRRNHSYYLSQYPQGRDATVSWGGPDFRFTNDLDTWVLISTAVTSSSVTVSIYGVDSGYAVDLSVSGWRNVKPFRVKETKDDTLELGKEVVETRGINGGQLVLTRKVSRGGTQVRSDTFTSNYVAVDQLVRVGTKVPESPEEDSE